MLMTSLLSIIREYYQWGPAVMNCINLCLPILITYLLSGSIWKYISYFNSTGEDKTTVLFLSVNTSALYCENTVSENLYYAIIEQFKNIHPNTSNVEICKGGNEKTVSKINESVKLLIIPSRKTLISEEKSISISIENQKKEENSNDPNNKRIVGIKKITLYHPTDITVVKKWLNEVLNAYVKKTYPSLEENFKYVYISDKYEKFRKYKTLLPNTMDNFYHVDSEKIKSILDNFLKHQELNTSPHRNMVNKLSLLLYGLPGCGKTSLIRIIAGITKRHIISINLNNIVSSSDLRNTLFSETIGITHGAIVPLKIVDVIYIFEELDCVLDKLKQRELSTTIEVSKDDKDNSTFHLGDMLEMMDGILQFPNRIMIFSTNYIDKLDDAFLRPGRLTHKIYFGKMSRQLAVSYILDYYQETTSSKYYNKIYNSISDDMFTPSKLEEICIDNSSMEKLYEKIDDKKYTQLKDND